MTTTECIAQSDALRPNALSESLKRKWLMELDGEIAEMMDKSMPEDGTLLMPYPHDQMYVLYLNAMIDNALEETDLYMNDIQLANSAVSAAKRWWFRNSKRNDWEHVKVL